MYLFQLFSSHDFFLLLLCVLLWEFSPQPKQLVSHWSLSDNKSPQVFSTLLSILANLNNAVVWMVSTHPLISKSYSPCTNPLVTVLRALITIDIIVTFMFFTHQTRLDWSGKVIHGELCKKLEFDYTDKWYMLNPESVLENKTHKLLRDFEIQTDNLISARRPDLIILNEKKKKMKTCKIVDFAVPANHRVKLKECEKRDKYLDLARELKKLLNIKVTIIPIVIGALGTVTKGLVQIFGGLGNNGTGGDCQKYSIVEIGQNT